MTLYFKQIQIGGYDKNFSYFIGDSISRQVAVVDPDNLDLLQELLAAENLKVASILLTHSHFDHVAGCKELAAVTGAKVAMHHKNPEAKDIPLAAIELLSDGDAIWIGSTKITAIETPGHTQDSLCYFIDGEHGGPKLITGDTLFIGGCGRCDLPGGNAEQMHDSLYNKILPLDPATIIYPGHDYGKVTSATLFDEQNSNPYLSSENMAEFVSLRMYH